MIAKTAITALAIAFLTNAGIVNGATYRIQRLDPPRSVRSFASDINDAGVVVGSFADRSDRNQGFVWEPSGIYHGVSSRESRGTLNLSGINALGTTVGTDFGEFSWQRQGLVRTDDGQILYKELPSDFYRPLFEDVDEFGNIVGNFQEPGGIFSSFIWPPNEPPRILELPDSPSGCNSAVCYTGVSGINNNGLIFGSMNYDGRHAEGFLYRLSDGFSEQVVYPGAESTHLRGINDLGDLVGYARMPSGPHVDFLRHADGSFEQVHFPEFWSFTLEGINNSGDLVGNYFTASQSPSRPFVAWSVPEPSTFVLAAASLPFVVLFSARRRVAHRKN